VQLKGPRGPVRISGWQYPVLQAPNSSDLECPEIVPVAMRKGMLDVGVASGTWGVTACHPHRDTSHLLLADMGQLSLAGVVALELGYGELEIAVEAGGYTHTHTISAISEADCKDSEHANTCDLPNCGGSHV
jgi:hypothetical protein